ncbi:HmuY family protein [Aliifodinibius salicampi]|uniref:HmuY family protein n=1 Tax=Fodinibius salicampi TaxID=1920655 RepID=A0ABT3PZJ4_9BACT|nr:HmuY family protein [Fodinibius salicampi]MCW9713240.1 HmuY family protein [Fodinibius salicampi]
MLPTTKKLYSLTLIAATLAFVFTACSNDTTGSNGEESQLETHTVTDISTGERGNPQIAYYSLRENTLVQDSASTEWDIAFSRTTIYTNSGSSGPGDGGAIVLDQSFEATAMAPSEGYVIDTSSTNLAIPTGSDNGWYHYNPSTHIVTPIEGKTIVIRTAGGTQYAKINILSYYKGNPDLSGDEFNNNPDNYPSGHYTFEYAIQLHGSRELQ